MPVQTLARFTQEMAIVLIGAAAFAEAGEVGGMSPEDVVVLWCIVGGCLGAFCSLHFFRVQPSAHIQADIAWQFFVNLILSGCFSPLLVPTAVKYSGLRPMQVAIAISCGVGILAQQAVAKVILPSLQKLADARAAKALKQLGVEPDSKD
jgi:hypothetical protein